MRAKIFSILIVLLFCLSSHASQQRAAGTHGAGVSTVVEWDCTAAGLDKYDATDGATTTNSGVSFSASGVNVDDGTDVLHFVASDGNNLDYDVGTIEFKYENTTGGTARPYSRFFELGTDAGSFCFRRYAWDTILILEIEDEDTTWTVTTNVFDGDEHTIRVTWDTTANERKLYIDGVQEGGTLSNALSTPTPTDTNFWFGCSNTADREVEGDLSDLKIWHSVVAP